MRLIITIDYDGTCYAAYESEAHFRSAEIERQQQNMRRLTSKDLDTECNLSHYIGCYHVVKLGRKPKI